MFDLWKIQFSLLGSSCHEPAYSKIFCFLRGLFEAERISSSRIQKLFPSTQYFVHNDNKLLKILRFKLKF